MSQEEKKAWHIDNLYDQATHSFYIPYELWTGGIWDGTKRLITNPVKKEFFVNRYSPTVIEGPEIWYHPILKSSYEVYQRKKLRRFPAKNLPSIAPDGDSGSRLCRRANLGAEGA